nr:hypothetical protein [Bacteroidota bacterium]
MLARMPKLDQKINVNDFELHILSQKDFIWMLYWAIRSFMFYSELCPKVVVHDDGSWDEKAKRLFENRFSNVEVLMKKDADEAIGKMTNLSDRVREARKLKGIPILKFTDVFLLAGAKKVMIQGNDGLFFGKPTEIVDLVKDRSGLEGLASDTHGPYPIQISKEYAAKHNFYEKKAHLINSDLLIFRRDLMSLKTFVEYFDNVPTFQDYFIEMVGLSVLMAGLNFELLEYDRYRIKGGVEPNTVMKHFTSPRRHELYAYGIDLVRERLDA